VHFWISIAQQEALLSAMMLSVFVVKMGCKLYRMSVKVPALHFFLVYVTYSSAHSVSVVKKHLNC
jgi:hypothetical protein